MRKRLPDTARVFIELLTTNPERIVSEIRLVAQGYTAAPADNVNGVARWLYEPRGRVWFFTQVAQGYGLHASEAREAYLNLPRAAQTSLDASIDAVLQTERDDRKGATMTRVIEEHGE